MERLFENTFFNTLQARALFSYMIRRPRSWKQKIRKKIKTWGGEEIAFDEKLKKNQLQSCFHSFANFQLIDYSLKIKQRRTRSRNIPTRFKGFLINYPYAFI